MHRLPAFIGLLVVLASFTGCDKETVIPPPDPGQGGAVDIIYLPVYGNTGNLGCADTVVLESEVSGASYLWSSGGETTQSIKLDADTLNDGDLYTVEVTTIDSSWVDSVYLYFNYALNIPNAFTPNGDAVNDYFLPFAHCAIASKMTIFNTSNSQKIFETEDITKGWDGRYDGKDVPIGEYPYKVEATFRNNATVFRDGTVQLIR